MCLLKSNWYLVIGDFKMRIQLPITNYQLPITNYQSPNPFIRYRPLTTFLAPPLEANHPISGRRQSASR
ncbi:MAG: hypothetical protein DYG85_10620 [Chloroflexi bacterium CFX1]|nr:hypothetical protein [Chloroflexi bacterium CFX1]MDL1918149.1 hypothetical protein [Chloroflexi bacterium CFX5]